MDLGLIHCFLSLYFHSSGVGAELSSPRSLAYLEKKFRGVVCMLCLTISHFLLVIKLMCVMVNLISDTRGGGGKG